MKKEKRLGEREEKGSRTTLAPLLLTLCLVDAGDEVTMKSDFLLSPS